MSDKATSYRDLEVWQISKKFAVNIYRATASFPRDEIYGLTSQLRRAGVSIPSNIAEGFRRKSPKEKVQFLRIAYGSGSEIETQIEIALDLGYFTKPVYDNLSGELTSVMKMLNVMISKTESMS